jgi:hypothetical protein
MTPNSKHMLIAAEVQIMRRFFNSIYLFMTMTSFVALLSAAVSAKGPVVEAKKLTRQARQKLLEVSPRQEVKPTAAAAAPSTKTPSKPAPFGRENPSPVGVTIQNPPTTAGPPVTFRNTTTTAVIDWSGNGVKSPHAPEVRRPVPLLGERGIVTTVSPKKEVKPDFGRQQSSSQTGHAQTGDVTK